MKKLAFLLALLLFAAVLVGCTPTEGSTTSAPPTSAGTSPPATGEQSSTRDDVVIHCEAPWNTMDPHGTGAYVDQYVINQMYEFLVNVTDDGTVVPELATDWTVSDDGLTYVFTLAKGVKFHNGQELKASDVVFSYNRAKTIPEMYDYTAMIAGTQANGDYEVTITLDTPFAPFLTYAARIFILNEAFTTENDSLNRVACGTGPYMLDQIEMNTEAKLTAFPVYRLGEASIKRVTFKIIIDTTTSVMSFRAGEIDFIYPNASTYLEMQGGDQFNTAGVATLHTAVIQFNNEVEPFNNKLVRQALNYAADRQTMVKISFEGLAVPALLLASEAAFGVDYAHAKEYPYDLQKAKDTLAEAGYPNGLNLGTMYTIAGGYHEKIAQVFQASCLEIGVTFEILPMESTTLIEMMTTGDYAFGNMGLSYSNDFAYNSRHYTTASIGSSNFDRYSNPRVDELFLLAQAETDPATRAAYYNEAVELITEDAPNIPVQHKQLLFAWNKALHAVPHVDSAKPYYVYEWSWQ